jgi:hypothetical protein
MDYLRIVVSHEDDGKALFLLMDPELKIGIPFALVQSSDEEQHGYSLKVDPKIISYYFNPRNISCFLQHLNDPSIER